MSKYNKRNHFLHQLSKLCLIIVFASCHTKDISSENTIFVEVESARSGLNIANNLIKSDSLNIIEYLYYYNGSGVAIGDINNDGWEDIYLGGNQVADKLYLNKGNMTFEDITLSSGLNEDFSWTTGVTIDDINGDGHNDIYVCKVGLINPQDATHNLLYINKGDGTFEEKSKEYGLNFRGFSTHASFFDFDKDGDLDVYLLNHNIHSVQSYGKTDKRSTKDSLAGDLLLENKVNQIGIFVDITEKAGIYSSPLGYGLALSTADINADGWPDIYVGNDFHENDYIYINNQNGTFTESVEKMLAHTTQFSMGVDIADMNQDGRMDIFTTDMLPYDPEVALVAAGEDSDQIKKIKKDFGFYRQTARNHFHLQTTNSTFSEVGYATHTYATDWSWSVLLEDFDQEGTKDIFITNGIVKRPNDLDYINYLNFLGNKTDLSAADRARQLIDKMPSQPLRNVLFKNQGPSKYCSLDSAFIGSPTFSTAAAYSDLDNDGDLDIVINNINQTASVLQNQSNNPAYIKIKLIGREDWPCAKGTYIKSYHMGNLIDIKEYTTTRGFMSSSSHIISLTSQPLTPLDSVQIIWPNNSNYTIVEPKTGETYTLTMPEAQTKYQESEIEYHDKGSFTVSVLPISHIDGEYFDENYEKLLPERLSQEGPAFLVEDFNEDGLSDIFIGGARSHAAQIYLRQTNGSYTKMKIEDFEKDAMYEDVDAALIDFDNDGDKDIYVVSGGNDKNELDKSLEDRLYLNNGKGMFKRIPISLPHTNGSCVSVGDIDNDGFEDLFVGARSIPKYYGLSPYSFLLRNVGGTGLEIVQKERYGMVTDAQIVDIDGDGDQDVVMCGDWMPITVLMNEGNLLFTDKTTELGFSSYQGMWNTLYIQDINKDGLLDILCGNVGINHKWTASQKDPVLMYVGDFDKNSASETILFYKYFNRYMPFLSMDRLTSQLPMLKKTFTTYQSFKGVSNIHDLHPDFEKEAVEIKKITELRSMAFLSNKGAYNPIYLPDQCQQSPINAFTIDQNDRMLYMGNTETFVAEIGPLLSSSGGIISFDSKQHSFRYTEDLKLPIDVSYRKIQANHEGNFLVSSYNNYIYILQRNE